MKKILFLSLAVVGLLFLSPSVSAQTMMMGSSNKPNTASQDSSTAQDEAKGKIVWDKLQAKQITCKDITDDDFDVLGDYFMGQMMGSSHTLMNSNMTKMMGDDGEKQMHIVMGKQYAGCTSSSAAPVQPKDVKVAPMMGGNWNQFYGFHILGLITWIIGIVFLLLGSIFFWKAITRTEVK